MHKRYLTLLLLIVLFIPGYTQIDKVLAPTNVKKRIGFVPFMDPDNESKRLRELVYEHIYDVALSILNNNKRFSLLDRGQFDIHKIENEFQRSEDLANLEIVTQGRSAKAELLAIAKIPTFIVTKSNDGLRFSVLLTVELKQLDVVTGNVSKGYLLTSEVKDPQRVSKTRIVTIEKAIRIAVQQLKDDLTDWISTKWPLGYKIIDIDREKRILFVDAGSGFDFSKENRFKIIGLPGNSDGDKGGIETVGELIMLEDEISGEILAFKMKSKEQWEQFLSFWQNKQKLLYAIRTLEPQTYR